MGIYTVLKKNMKKTTLIVFAILIAGNIIAQEKRSFQVYEDLFARVDNTNMISKLDVNLPTAYRGNSILDYNKVYEILLIFRDNRPSEKWQFTFKSSEYALKDLLDPRKELQLLKGGVTRSISKDDLEYFILGDIVFENSRKKEIKKYVGGKGLWGIQKINGPIKVVQKYLKRAEENGYFLDEDIRINSEAISWNPLKWKEEMAAYIADYKELSQKVLDKEEGYRKKDQNKIIIEYNSWVKENDPQRFKSATYPKQFIENAGLANTSTTSLGYSALFKKIEHKKSTETFSVSTNYSATNNIFSPDSLYDIKLYYRDGRPSEEVKFSFNPKKFLKKYYQPKFTGKLLFYKDVTEIPVIKDQQEVLVKKSDLLYYVLNKSYIFVHSSAYNHPADWDYWGLLSMNGPISQVKWYKQYLDNVNDETLCYFNGEPQKVNWVDGLGRWKKYYAELLTDNNALVEKIANKEKGYKGLGDARNIALEYNNWVLENDPKRFGKYIKPE